MVSKYALSQDLKREADRIREKQQAKMKRSLAKRDIYEAYTKEFDGDIKIE